MGKAKMTVKQSLDRPLVGRTLHTKRGCWCKPFKMEVRIHIIMACTQGTPQVPMGLTNPETISHITAVINVSRGNDKCHLQLRVREITREEQLYDEQCKHAYLMRKAAGKSPFTPIIQQAVYETISPELKARTLELAARQGCKPLKKGSKLAKAREEVHTTGTSFTKVRRNTRLHQNNKKKTTDERAEKRAAMLAKREKLMENTIDYEGFFFTLKHQIGVNAEEFEELVARSLQAIRDKLNTEKSAFETLMGIPSDKFFRFALSVTCALVSVVFAYQAVTEKSWVSTILAGIAAVGAGYFVGKEVFALAKEVAWDYCKAHYDIPEFQGNEEDIGTDEDIRRMYDEALRQRMKNQEDGDAPPDVAPESGWIFNAGGSVVAELVHSIVVGGVGMSVMNGKRSFVENVSRIPSVSTGIMTLVDLVIKWISSMVDTLFGTNLSTYFSTNSELDSWVQSVLEFAQGFDEGDIKPSPVHTTHVCEMLRRGREMVANKMITTPAGHNMHRLAMKELEKLQLSFSKQGIGNETLPEAFSVLLMGESGVGKSAMTHRLMKYIGARVMDRSMRADFKRSYHSHVYAVMSEQEHWNGYANQFFAVMDDLAQQKPAPGEPTEGIRVIRAVNANPMSLNMAALHEKGKAWFTSRFLFASTNLYKFWNLNIVQPEAFLRRWKIIATVVPRAEWCTEATKNADFKDRRLDVERIKAQTGKKGYFDGAVEIHLQKILDPKQQTMQTVKVMSVGEFEDYIVDGYNAVMKQHHAAQEDMQEGANLREEYAEKAEKYFEETGEELPPFRATDYEGLFTSTDAFWHWRNGMYAQVGTRRLSWKDWFMHTSLRVKAKSFWERNVLLNTKPATRRLQRAISAFWESLQGGAVYLRDILKESLRENFFGTVLSLALIWSLVFQPLLQGAASAINWVTEKAGDVTASWRNRPPAADPDEDPICFGTRVSEFEEVSLERFIELATDDQAAYLKKSGITPVPENERNMEPLRKYVLSKVARDGFLIYHATHTTGRKFKVTKDMVPQSALFVGCSAYTESARRYVDAVHKSSVYHMYGFGCPMEKEYSAGTVVMVNSTYMLINKHYISEMTTAVRNGYSGDQDVKFVPHGRPQKVVSIPISHMVDPSNHYGGDDGEDAMLVNCDPYMGIHKDIVGKFIKQGDSDRVRDHAFSVYTPPNPTTMRQHEVLGTFADTVRVGDNHHKGMFWYQAPTEPGDCGGLIIESGCSDPKERIVGIHAAGERVKASNKMAFGQRISQELLRKWLAAAPEKVQARPEQELTYETSLLGLQVVRIDEKCNHITTSHNIVPSYMHGWSGPPERIPVKIEDFVNTEGEKVSPLKNMLLKEHANNVALPQDFVDVNCTAVIEELLPFAPKPGLVYTFEQGVGGDGAGLKALNMRSSGGYYSLYNKWVGPGKKGALGADGIDLTTENAKRLERDVMSTLKHMEMGQPADEPCTLFAKAEKKSVSKVEQGKVRAIKGYSLVSTIIARMIFGATISKLNAAPVFSGMLVGIDPFTDWDVLARQLKAKGGKVIAGDFSGFDASQSGQLIRAVCEMLWTLSGHTCPKIRKVFECMKEDLAAPRVIVGKFVYQNDHGLPSGHPFTTVMNSLFNMLAFRMAWTTLMREQTESALACARRMSFDVMLKVYGDDNIAGISDGVCERFNQHTLTPAFKSLGLTFTSDDKEDANPKKYRTLEECTTLKRGYRYEPVLGKVVAPLDLRTLMEVCYYTKAGGEEESITRDNVERTLRELALHGEATYTVVGGELVAYHNERSFRPILKPPWKVCLREVVGDYPGFKDTII